MPAISFACLRPASRLRRRLSMRLLSSHCGGRADRCRCTRRRRALGLCRCRQFWPDGHGRCAGIARYLWNSTRQIVILWPAVPRASPISPGVMKTIWNWRARMCASWYRRGDCLISYRQAARRPMHWLPPMSHEARGAKLLSPSPTMPDAKLFECRCLHSAGDAAGNDFRLDPHGCGHGAEDRAQHVFHA
jgi:hypothetical protein